jgi:hypothetical protein
MPWVTPTINSEILAIHAAVLPTNEVLLFGGDEHSSAQHHANDIDNTRLYDIANPKISPMSSPTTDVFCSGHAFLADGRLVVGGGTEAWVGDVAYHDHGLGFPGHRACWEYRPRARTWRRVADMNREPGHPDQGGGRWYPTLVTLANGEVLALFGHPGSTDERHRNDSPERYSAGANAWFALPTIAEAAAIPYTTLELNYPRVYVLRDGDVFFATSIGGCRVYDPFTGAWAGSALPAPSEHLYSQWYGSAVLLPLLPGDGYAARVMHVGAVTPRVMNVHAATPQWAQAGTRQGAAAGRVRENLVAVLLPTGQVFLSGGDETVNPEAPVLEPEIYTPDIDWSTNTYGTGPGSWESKEPAAIPRNYHSTALLLPDGTVWTAGSSINANQGPPATTGRLQIEIYEPDYVAGGGRPQITGAPAAIDYGRSFDVDTPQAASIERVAIIRAGSVTHACDLDQRYVGLDFDQVDGNTLRCTGPPSGGVAPPGWYMLWIVDGSDRPCQTASWVRLAHRRCTVITDRSTFSSFEVEALGEPAQFPNALYVIFEGFLPQELGTPVVAPTPTVTFDAPAGPAAPAVSVTLRDTLFEDATLPQDVVQRVTFAFDVTFANATPFDTFTETRSLNARFTHGGHVCDATLDLIKQPNPYMLDGPVHWLSTDVRVFQIRPGQTRAGVVHPSGTGAPFTFLQQLLTAFRAAPNDPSHPFHGISEHQEASRLELAREVGGQRVYNYAIAKVRYRALTVDATNVRVFFRAFNTVGPALEFNNPGTYSRAGTGAATIAVLGLRGGELVSIPFFAEPRVDTSTQSMSAQTDPLNRQTLEASGMAEFTGYFGCWLDINQTEPHFPLHPSGNGPYTDRVSIQQLIRGRHQCLVAEVFFEPEDPIHTGETPGSSDNLSQRNLAIVESANPGAPATRTVHHTFDVRPSAVAGDWLGDELGGQPELPAAAAFDKRRGGPDELMIRWGDLPAGTQATIYWPSVAVDEVLRRAGRRRGDARLERADEHTLRVRVAGDVTFVPVPGGGSQPIAGLLSIELPEGVTAGDVYTITGHQWSGVTRQVLGSFQLTIPVRHAEQIVPRAEHDLAVLWHISEAIPAGDRWRPVFDRYLGALGDRVRGFGGDPDDLQPSPAGTGGDGRDGDGEDGDGRGHKLDRLCRLLGCLTLAAAIETAVLAVLVSGRRKARAQRRALDASAIATGLLALKLLVLRCAGLCRGCPELARPERPARRKRFPFPPPPRTAAPEPLRDKPRPPSGKTRPDAPPAILRKEREPDEDKQRAP